VRFTVLGSNASSPGRTNAASGYLVEGAEGAVLLDAGPGTFMRLADRIDPRSLSGVVISHLHVDHCSDLFGLYAYLAYEADAEVSVPVLGPRGSRDRFARFIGADDGHVLHRVLAFEELAPGAVAYLGGYRVTVGEAVHPVPALVSRLEAGGASLVYSGDTGPGGDLIELATDTSTLLCEAAMQGVRTSDTYPYHLTAFEAGEIAAAAGAFELVVTHIPSRLDPETSVAEASGAYVGPISYADPGTTFRVRTWE
jgi:ribonuclease BN (tRNA processing enzyme)